jgi:hypothetical protein
MIGIGIPSIQSKSALPITDLLSSGVGAGSPYWRVRTENISIRLLVPAETGPNEGQVKTNASDYSEALRLQEIAD